MAKSSSVTLPLNSLGIETQKAVRRARTTKKPVVITARGQSAAVLVDAGEYELQQRRIDLMERIVRAERDVAEGRTYTQQQVRALIDQWFDEDA